MRESTTLLLPQYFIPIFAIAWFGITGLLAHLGGWATLSPKYRNDNAVPGETFRFVSGSMGHRFIPVNYGNCLFVAAGSDGFRLSILFPFRFQCPPLFVPWSDVESVTEKRFLGIFRYAVIVVRDQWPRISIRGRAADAVHRAYVAHVDKHRGMRSR
jgi:hypothetical protein